MKHSNEPWEMKDRFDYRFNPCGMDIVSEGRMVCRMPDGATVNGGKAFPETKADAYLITAAPDLLHACKSVSLECRDYNRDGDIIVPSHVWDLISKAIAKAEGLS